MRRLGSGLGVAVVGGTLVMLVGSAHAQLDLSKTQRAADGTVYEVIRVPSSSLLAGVDGMRVTTVSGGTTNGLVGCSAAGGGSGQPTKAASGADPTVPQILRPYDETVRTGIITPANETINFESGGAGRLILGTGAGALEVCRVASDCTGFGTQSLVPLSSNQGSVPPACVATNVPSCTATQTLTTFAFGLLDAGNPPNCTTTPTTVTTVCNTSPADGFSLAGGQLVVFVYNHSLGMSGFTSGVSGFGIDDGASAICSSETGRVITADGKTFSAPPPPQPVCGDGHLDAGEECDDGNQIDGDGCNTDCMVSSRERPPTQKQAPAMAPVVSLITAAGLVLLGGRALRRRN